MARVLITGATGFLGRGLVLYLLRRGYNVVTAGRQGSCEVTFDIADPRAVEARLAEIGSLDAVIHLAGLARPGKYDLQTFRRVNVEGAANVLGAAAQRGIRKCVFYSTTLVYGTNQHGCPAREATERHPTNAYARSKCEAEDVVQRLADQGAKIVTFRCAPVYDRQNLQTIIARVEVPLTGGVVVLSARGDSAPVHSLCARQNLEAATAHALGESVPAGCYNIADPQPYSLEEMKRAIMRVRPRFGLVSLPVARAASVALVCARAASSAFRSQIEGNIEKVLIGSSVEVSKFAHTGFEAVTDLFECMENKPFE